MREHLEVISAIKRELDKKGIGKLMFLCLSGSHSYGWATKDSDYDYRGIFIADTNKLLGLDRPNDIFELEIGKNEIVLFELRKAMELILKGNSNVLEWFYSEPVYTTKESLALKHLIIYEISKNVYDAYKGMATYNYKKFIKQGRKTVKKYLYIIRALMAGIYALEGGKIIPNIRELMKENQFYYYSDTCEHLLYLKEANKKPDKSEEELFESAIDDLFYLLDRTYGHTKLPEEPDREVFNKLLLGIRRSYS